MHFFYPEILSTTKKKLLENLKTRGEYKESRESKVSKDKKGKNGLCVEEEDKIWREVDKERERGAIEDKL